MNATYSPALFIGIFLVLAFLFAVTPLILARPCGKEPARAVKNLPVR